MEFKEFDKEKMKEELRNDVYNLVYINYEKENGIKIFKNEGNALNLLSESDFENFYKIYLFNNNFMKTIYQFGEDDYRYSEVNSEEFDENTKPIIILNELLSMRPVLVIDMDHHLSIVNGFEYELDKSIDLEETADIIYETNPSRMNILSRKEQTSIDYTFFIKSIKPLSSTTDKWVFIIKKPTAII